MRVLTLSASAVLAALVSTPASAHVSLETQQAVAGSYYKAVVRVPHGCEGSPTTRIRVRIPDGAAGVKPQPKTGWELTTVKGKLAQPFDDGHGNKITEGIVEVVWSGGKLLDEHYDEFVFRMQLPKTPNVTAYVPVVQECEKGIHRWIEVPAAGKSADDYKEPAPGIKLLPRP
jgi:periplasmic copper chaperone A